MRSSPDPLGPITTARRNRLRRAFRMLLDAFDTTAKCRRDAWEFAIEVRRLRAVGVTAADLRWLIDRNYVQGVVEKSNAADRQRVFGKRSEQSLSNKGRLVLTKAGFRAARILIADRPFYDRELRELYARGQLVKLFKQPAPDQDAVLSSFEELGWPRRMDDPLRRKHGRQGANVRLRDTIKRLNRRQQRPLIRFRGDGTGKGIIWEYVDGPGG